MRTADFDYSLPPELIAQQPIEPRDRARLLVLDRLSGALHHRWVRDLPRLLSSGDLVVVNRTRVLPARLAGRLASGGRVEVLLLRRVAARRWLALTRPARRLRAGTLVEVSVSPGLRLRVAAEGEAGLREVVVEPAGAATDAECDALLFQAGTVPLPPYIRAWAGDPERYQTMFADEMGSAAAPTAGLHFTPELVRRLADAGVQLGTIVLHVGLDTFRPVAEEDPAEHPMHSEWYQVSAEVQAGVAMARASGRRVVAVGTTCVRALEAWAATGRPEGWTDLFIMPGYEMKVVDALLTNFHLPRSTLLMLVSAFAGRERILAAYRAAIAERYRFYSFGDAMLIT